MEAMLSLRNTVSRTPAPHEVRIRPGDPSSPGPEYGACALASEVELTTALRQGREDVFMQLVRSWSPAMLRVAEMHAPGHAVAEEIVQETWIGVLRGLDRFEGRSSLRTWVFRILTNQAKTRGARERRTTPFCDAFGEGDPEAFEPSVDPGRFRSDDDPQGPRHWARPPQKWVVPGPESAALATEIRTRLGKALERLPVRQRAVVSLRDVQGYSAADVARMLELSEANQRVLLHRGRAKLRAELEDYLTER